MRDVFEQVRRVRTTVCVVLFVLQVAPVAGKGEGDITPRLAPKFIWWGQAFESMISACTSTDSITFVAFTKSGSYVVHQCIQLVGK